jgi:3-oxosteroid 1-dehydrogenase
MVLGGMMVGKNDIPFLLKPFQSVGAFFHVAGLLLRHLSDRLRHCRGTRLVMGNALVARLLMSLKRQDVPILYDTRLVELVRVGGAVIGALVEGPGGKQHVRARHGVVLAAGGIGWNAGLRAELFPPTAQQLSLAPTKNAGEGIEAARRLGGALDDKVASAGLWMPCSILKRPDGTTSVYPHIVLDRAKPGLIAVNGAGRRFVNEADSYHDFCLGMLRSHQDVPSVPSYLLCDRRFIADYGIGLIHPGTRKLQRFIDAGYLIEAQTLQALATQIHVDAAVLEQTVARHNRYAVTGNDEDFGRGSSDLNRVNGDPTNLPNPCMKEIGPGPYYAVAVYPADLGSSAGLRTDSDGRVLSQDEEPIAGLYACGNDAVSIFRGAYPGPGATLGPALVFAWRAAMHAAKT